MHLQPDLEPRLPIGRYAYVDVAFTAPDADTDIAHGLRPDDPDMVRWLVVSADEDTVVYRDSSVDAIPWERTHVWLRATMAANVRLLLFLEP